MIIIKRFPNQKKLRIKYKIKRPEEIQTGLEKIKQTIQAKTVIAVKAISKTISFLQK